MSFRHLMQENFNNHTTESRVSLEGFGDLLTKAKEIFSRTKAKPGEMLGEKAYTPEAKKAKVALLQAITSQYGNRRWLEKQTLVTDPIPAKDISKIFEIDGKVGTDPLGNIETALKRLGVFLARYNQELKTYDQRLQAIYAKLAKDIVALHKRGAEDEELEKRMDDGIHEMQRIPSPLRNVPTFTGTCLGNTVPTVMGQGDKATLVVGPKTPPKGADTLPALTIDQIQKASGMLAQLLDDTFIPDYYLIHGLDHSDGSDFNEITQDRIEHKYDDLYDAFYFQTLWDKYTDGIWIFVDEWALARALERYINRSIQG